MCVGVCLCENAKDFGQHVYTIVAQTFLDLVEAFKSVLLCDSRDFPEAIPRQTMQAGPCRFFQQSVAFSMSLCHQAGHLKSD